MAFCGGVTEPRVVEAGGALRRALRTVGERSGPLRRPCCAARRS
jgi:hypothetical protein